MFLIKFTKPTFNILSRLNASLLLTNRGLVSCQVKRQKTTEDSSANDTDNHTSDSNSDSSTTTTTTLEDIKNEILEASLDFVKEHGWTQQSIAKGASSVGYCGTTHGLFSHGGTDLVNYFTASCNRRLARQLFPDEQQPQQQIPSKQQTVHCLQTALEVRLKMLIPFIEHWPMAMAHLASPSNIVESSRSLATLVDDVWYYAGDRTPNLDWYTKRFGLAAVYVATELVMVQDKSKDFVDTWSFLKRRLQQIEQAKSVLDELPNFVRGSSEIIVNMLGFGYLNSRENPHGSN